MVAAFERDKLTVRIVCAGIAHAVAVFVIFDDYRLCAVKNGVGIAFACFCIYDTTEKSARHNVFRVQLGIVREDFNPVRAGNGMGVIGDGGAVAEVPFGEELFKRMELRS